MIPPFSDLVRIRRNGERDIYYSTFPAGKSIVFIGIAAEMKNDLLYIQHYGERGATIHGPYSA
jgi:hypothetical protein